MSCYQKFYTNQIHSSSLLCQLATMWKSQVLCDAIIKSGTVNIKAHRVVLVAACPMLQSMENAAVGSHLEVRLASDIKQDSINAFLQYLYEGFMMLTEENCKDVEKIARLLQVDSVIKCCADFYKCLSTKTGNTDLNDPYKYTFHDMVEFRHVRSSDIQKTYQSRLVKRTSDFPRPVSPNSKRQKIHRPSSPYTGTHKPDDTISMSHGYNNASSNPWDRVPWLPASKRGHHNTPQPGVIDIVEDSLELVQTNPGSKGKGDRPQESVSVGVASSINSSSDVQIVDIVEPSGSTPFISSNTAGIGVMSQNDASVSSDRNTDSSPASLSRGSDKQSSSANRDPLERVMQSTQFSTPSHQRSDADTSISFSRSSESYSYSSPSLSMSGQRLMPNSRSFAAGSLLQSGASHGQRVSGLQPPPLSRGPKPVTHTEGSGDKDYSDRDSDDQLTDKPPDLSIVKIEAVGAESTGGLDMSVDILDDKVHSEVEHEDGSETEHDQSTDWIPEEMSNEASNVSADQNSTWYMGHSQGKGDQQQHLFEVAGPTSQVYQFDDSHRLVHIKGIKRACAYCSMQRVKYKSGWSIKSYFKCEECDVPLCKASKDCFERYHAIRQSYPDLTPTMLKREWKAMNRVAKSSFPIPIGSSSDSPIIVHKIEDDTSFNDSKDSNTQVGKKELEFKDINPWF